MSNSSAGTTEQDTGQKTRTRFWRDGRAQIHCTSCHALPLPNKFKRARCKARSMRSERLTTSLAGRLFCDQAWARCRRRCQRRRLAGATSYATSACCERGPKLDNCPGRRPGRCPFPAQSRPRTRLGLAGVCSSGVVATAVCAIKAAGPYKIIGFGGIDVTKPYKFYMVW